MAYSQNRSALTYKIASVADFARLKVPACVRAADANAIGLPSWLATNQPRVQLRQLNGTVYDLLDAVANGTCAGALASDVDVRFALGPLGDPGRAYCGLQTVGELLVTGPMAIPFGISLNQGVMNALNEGFFFSVTQTGGWAANVAANLPGESLRSQCPVSSVSTATVAYDVTDLAGIYVVMSLGTGARYRRAERNLCVAHARQPRGDGAAIGLATVLMQKAAGFVDGAALSRFDWLPLRLLRELHHYPRPSDLPTHARELLPGGALQTDASVDRANSGCALLDSAGRLMGVCTAPVVAARAGTGPPRASSLGFAVPVDVVRAVVPQLIAYGRVVDPVLA